MPESSEKELNSNRMFSLFQQANGSLHLPSLLMFLSWVAGSGLTAGFMIANLKVNRNDRVKAADAAKVAAARINTLEERTSKRRIIGDQADRVTEAISALGTGYMNVTAVMNDSEAIQFAFDLEQCFKAAGWKTDRYESRWTGTPKNLSLLVHSEESAPAYAGAIQHILASEGYPTEGDVNPTSVPEGSIMLLIGNKE